MKLSRFLPLVTLALVFAPLRADAHCDSMNGPVVKNGLEAIARKDVRLVLRWVRESDEAAVKAAFSEAMHVRTLSPEAAKIADRHFLETLVRLHRNGEGAPYTGLKDGESVSPAVRLADEALVTGTVADLRGGLLRSLEERVTALYERVRTLRPQESTDVEAGRRFVAAYVTYVHTVEALERSLADVSEHAHGEKGGAAAHPESEGAGKAPHVCPEGH